MLTVERLNERNTIIQSLTVNGYKSFSANEYREGLKKLKKLFKVGNSASVSVNADSWVVTRLTIRVKEDTQSVKDLIEAVSELTWSNPESDAYTDYEAGSNVRMDVQHLHYDEETGVRYYA